MGGNFSGVEVVGSLVSVSVVLTFLLWGLLLLELLCWTGSGWSLVCEFDLLQAFLVDMGAGVAPVGFFSGGAWM